MSRFTVSPTGRTFGWSLHPPSPISSVLTENVQMISCENGVICYWKLRPHFRLQVSGTCPVGVCNSPVINAAGISERVVLFLLSFSLQLLCWWWGWCLMYFWIGVVAARHVRAPPWHLKHRFILIKYAWVSAKGHFLERTHKFVVLFLHFHKLKNVLF